MFGDGVEGGVGGILDVSVDSLEEVCVCVFACVCVRFCMCVRVWYTPCFSLSVSISLPACLPACLPLPLCLSPSLSLAHFLSLLIYIPLSPSPM
jgi:hypothetical protein